MRRALMSLSVLLPPVVVHAQMAVESPLVRALLDGHASTPLPASQGAQLVAQKIREKTGSPGDVTVEFIRIVRFQTQPRCGRVGYGLYQHASQTFWGQFGGQMNICEDGAPPQRACKGQSALVTAETQCRDGSYPTDTPEVQAAIAKAAANGSVTGEQFTARFEAQRLKHRGGE